MRTRRQAIDSRRSPFRSGKTAHFSRAHTRPLPHSFQFHGFRNFLPPKIRFRQPKPSTWAGRDTMSANRYSLRCDWSLPITFAVTPHAGHGDGVHDNCATVHRTIRLVSMPSPRATNSRRNARSCFATNSESSPLPDGFSMRRLSRGEETSRMAPLFSGERTVRTPSARSISTWRNPR